MRGVAFEGRLLEVSLLKLKIFGGFGGEKRVLQSAKCLLLGKCPGAEPALYVFFLDTTDSSRVSLKHLSGVAKALAREDHLKSVPKHTGEALAWRNLLRSNPRSYEGAQT